MRARGGVGKLFAFGGLVLFDGFDEQ